MSSFTKAQSTPDWWTDPATAIYENATPPTEPEHYSPVNVGQLKYVATQAKAYLDSIYTGLDWNWAYEGSGVTNPFPFVSQDNYSPVNVGQIKAVAYGFYKILDSRLHGSSQNISDFGGSTSSLDGFTVPWDSIITGENSDVANIGQLKLVFSFWPDRDTIDADGLADYWEKRIWGNTTTASDPNGDVDGDGISNIEEFQTGGDPSADPLSGVVSPQLTQSPTGMIYFRREPNGSTDYQFNPLTGSVTP
ncbi:hypothetical protein [Oceanipulchritudo coccoides]|nr:hypothetical protein [Oceanipulchritudo coccoides]